MAHLFFLYANFSCVTATLGCQHKDPNTVFPSRPNFTPSTDVVPSGHSAVSPPFVSTLLFTYPRGFSRPLAILWCRLLLLPLCSRWLSVKLTFPFILSLFYFFPGSHQLGRLLFLTYTRIRVVL